MKPLLLAILICLSFTLTLFEADVFAYQIEARDKYTYEFKDGQITLKKGLKYECIYEVNKEEKIITQLTAVTTIEGETVDTAKGYEKQIYNIISDTDGNLTATRLRPQGEEIIAFKNDRTYCFFVTTYLTGTPAAIVEIKGFYSILTFGNYNERTNN